MADKWSIQIFYQARDDNGKAFRATSVFHTETASKFYDEAIGESYANAEKALGPNYKLGAIMAGHHLRFP